MAITGLKPVETALGNIIFQQARLILECRKIYTDFLKPEYFIDPSIDGKIYPAKDYHKFFIGEIVECYIK
jgi:hypothetical protein